MKLHAAIDAIGAKHGGAATVLTDLLNATISDDRFATVSVFCSPRERRTFDLPVATKIQAFERDLCDVSRSYRLWWQETRLSREALSQGADVLLCLNGMGYGGAIPQVNFIQQSLPFCPDIWRKARCSERVRLAVMLRAMRRSCSRSHRVIVQTATMRKAVIDAFRLSPSRVSVVPSSVQDLPVADIPSPKLAAMRRTMGGLRLLYVGSDSDYKNVALLLEAVKKVRMWSPDVGLFLTLPRDHRLLRQVNSGVGIGYLSGSELREAYELATILVMPSLVETVGLPMLEAMNTGTPVLAADRPYARDVCEDAAMFFDPLDADDLASKALLLLSDWELRRKMVAKGMAVVVRRRNESSYERVLDILVESVAAAPRA